MNRSTRMMLLSKGGESKERRRRMGIEYEDWTPQDNYSPSGGGAYSGYRPFMPPTYDGDHMGRMGYMNYGEPESAFYDRRGRRHYDNGRYAPQNRWDSGRMGDMNDMEDMEPESRRRFRRYSDGRFAPRSDYGGGGREMYDRESYRPPRMIGFGRDWNEDATMPQYREMDRMSGSRAQHGYASGSGTPKFTRKMADEWVRDMQNADGTHGPHWPREKAKEIMEQYKVDCDPDEFYAVLNAMYSDYCEALKKNNASKMDIYVDLAKAWIEDDDAVKDKAAAYFLNIVEH